MTLLGHLTMLALSLALSNDHADACAVLVNHVRSVIAILQCDAADSHAVRFLLRISSLFQLNEAEMLPYGGFPVHILTISNASSIL